MIIFYLQNKYSFILLIFYATHRESVRSRAGAHVGNVDIEVEVSSIRAANCTAPIVADGTDIVERTKAVTTEARHGQFKRRGKSPCSIITVPT